MSASATATYVALNPKHLPIVTHGAVEQTHVDSARPVSRAAAESAAAATELIRLVSSRIADSTHLTAQIDPVDAVRAQQLLGQLSVAELIRLQVLLGHAVTAVATHRRRRGDGR